MQHQDYNKGGLIVFLFAMVFVFVFFIYISFFHEHHSPDYRSAETATPAPTPPPAPVSDQPWVSTPELVQRGEGLFQTNCAICHGPKGLGDGPAGKALQPPPRNFVEGKWRYGGNQFQIFKVISEGSPGTSMASWKATIPEGDRWALVAFIQSITKNRVEATAADIKAYKEGQKK